MSQILTDDFLCATDESVALSAESAVLNDVSDSLTAIDQASTSTSIETNKRNDLVQSTPQTGVKIAEESVAFISRAFLKRLCDGDKSVLPEPIERNLPTLPERKRRAPLVKQTEPLKEEQLHPARKCVSCQTNKSLMWRSGLGATKNLCNPCGLRLATHLHYCPKCFFIPYKHLLDSECTKCHIRFQTSAKHTKANISVRTTITKPLQPSAPLPLPSPASPRVNIDRSSIGDSLQSLAQLYTSDDDDDEDYVDHNEEEDDNHYENNDNAPSSQQPSIDISTPPSRSATLAETRIPFLTRSFLKSLDHKQEPQAAPKASLNAFTTDTVPFMTRSLLKNLMPTKPQQQEQQDDALLAESAPSSHKRKRDSLVDQIELLEAVDDDNPPPAPLPSSSLNHAEDGIERSKTPKQRKAMPLTPDYSPEGSSSTTPSTTSAANNNLNNNNNNNNKSASSSSSRSLFDAPAENNKQPQQQQQSTFDYEDVLPFLTRTQLRRLTQQQQADANTTTTLPSSSSSSSSNVTASRPSVRVVKHKPKKENDDSSSEPNSKAVLRAHAGQLLLCFWSNQWYPVEVIKVDRGRALVHYVGYDDSFNEWVARDSQRLRLVPPPSALLTSNMKNIVASSMDASALLASSSSSSSSTTTPPSTTITISTTPITTTSLSDSSSSLPSSSLPSSSTSLPSSSSLPSLQPPVPPEQTHLAYLNVQQKIAAALGKHLETSDALKGPNDMNARARLNGRCFASPELASASSQLCVASTFLSAQIVWTQFPASPCWWPAVQEFLPIWPIPSAVQYSLHLRLFGKMPAVEEEKAENKFCTCPYSENRTQRILEGQGICGFAEAVSLADSWYALSLFGRLWGQEGKDTVQRLSGMDVNVENFSKHGFAPCLVSSPIGLGMKMPSAEEFTLREIVNKLGKDREVPVIDVANQLELNDLMKLGDLAAYFESGHDVDPSTSTATQPTPSQSLDDIALAAHIQFLSAAAQQPRPRRNRILNVLSMEISTTPLSDNIRVPKIVRELDWAQTIWPSTLRRQGIYPHVQLYCLLSAHGSFTDFHIDFGGSSVFYHVISGEKIFYLVPPTKVNLERYEIFHLLPDPPGGRTWSKGSFADLIPIEDRFYCRVQQGETLFLPSGWIHAVVTPCDSIVIGGNFLHSLNIETQLVINAMENRTATPAKFQFPLFTPMMWFAIDHFAARLTRGDKLKPFEQGSLDVLCVYGRSSLLEAAKLLAEDANAPTSLPFTLDECWNKLEVILKHLETSSSSPSSASSSSSPSSDGTAILADKVADQTDVSQETKIFADIMPVLAADALSLS